MLIILKNQINNQLSIAILKKFLILQNVLFFITNLSQGIVLHYPNFNTACTPTEMKQNVLH